jgi:hypothetical protein
MFKYVLYLAYIFGNAILSLTQETIVQSSLTYIPLFNQEIEINTGTEGNYLYCNVKRLSDDNVVVTYENPNTKAMNFQMFDSFGNKLTTLMSVTSLLDNSDNVAPLSNGQFIILTNTASAIKANIYNNDGTSTKQPISISISGSFDQYLVVPFADGGFAILWTVQNGLSFRCMFFDANGKALTNEIPVNYGGKYSSAMYAPSAVAITNDSFMCCFKMDSEAQYLNCDVFSHSGTTGTPIQIDFYNDVQDRNSVAVAKLQDGNFAVVSSGSSNVNIAIISSSLELIQSNTLVSDTSGSYPTIVNHSNGDFSVFFTGKVNLLGFNRDDIAYQRFSSTYQKIGANQILNTNIFGKERDNQSVVEFNGSDLATCWSVYDPQNFDNIYFQIFSTNGSNNNNGNSNGGSNNNNNNTPNKSKCSDFTILTKASAVYSLSDDFKDNITDDNVNSILIYFTKLADLGFLVKGNGDSLTINKGYPINDIYYATPGYQTNNTLTYYASNSYNIKSNICHIFIGVCYSSCETCSTVGNDSNHTCTTCKQGYKLLNSNCYKTCPSVLNGINYYEDPLTNTCPQCLESCDSCTNGNTCSTCKKGYLYVQNATSNNCLTSCPVGYSLFNNTICNPCEFKNSNGTCLNCKGDNKYYYDNSCLDFCPSGLTPNINNTCIKCDGIIYKGLCYDKCPDKTFYDDELKTCYTCEDKKLKYFNNTCVTACPLGSAIIKDNICENCKSLGLYYYQYQCVPICPFGTVENNLLGLCDLWIIKGKRIFNV